MLSPGPQVALGLTTLWAFLSAASCWHSSSRTPYYYGGTAFPLQPVARGSATFLTGPPPVLPSAPAPPPPLGPALPAPILLSLVPYAQASRYEASLLPSERVYHARGRPAIIPTPYAKYSESIGLGKRSTAWQHPNALTSAEPGFYGSQRYPASADDVRDYPSSTGSRFGKAAVGFYGKAS